MNLKYTSIIASLMLLGPVHAQEWPACGTVDDYPGAEWEQSDAQALGWDLGQLQYAEDVYSDMESAGVMVVHRGKLIASWGEVDEKYTNASMRKALIHSVVGNAIEVGHFSLDDTLADLNIQESVSPLSDVERSATVADILRSRSGIFHSALFEIGGWKNIRMELEQSDFDPNPGDFWIYNNWDFNVIGTILEQQSGKKIGDMFNDQIAQKIKMQDFEVSDVGYMVQSDFTEKVMDNVSDFAAYDFKTSVRDLARYGLMYLDCGKWNGEQVIPKNWVEISIDGPAVTEGAPQDFQDWFSGMGSYGYLQWIEKPGKQKYFPDLQITSPWYYGSGYRGHFYMVWPALDLVIAHQVSNWGGNSLIGQVGRRLFGAPTVEEWELSHLLHQIILAHPQGNNAFLPSEDEVPEVGDDAIVEREVIVR